jgi:hypothetical protein
MRIAPLAIAALVSGCSFYARSPAQYRDATAAVLQTKEADIKACYDTALKAKPDLAGTVTVHFTVAKSTGKFGDVTTTMGSSPTPDALNQCIVAAISGLTLAPPDKRNGDATFDYAFTIAQK